MQSKKYALVSGASSGIGLAITQHLLNIGWHVTALSRRAPLIKHPLLTFVSIDLSSDNFQSHLNELHCFDAIIHAAGMMKTDPLGAINSNDGELMWKLHVLAPTQIVNKLAPVMSNGGRIILIGSRTATGAANRSQYAASKSALIGLTRSWALELIDRQITVNVVSPGATETPMLLSPTRKGTPPKLPPMGRFIQPSEIAGTIEFLLSDNAKSITGQNIVICGGGSL